MTTPKLKPCPFCGGVAILCDHKFYDDKTKNFSNHTYGVKCIKCNAHGWQFYDTKNDAINEWNRRTTNEQ